MIRADRGALLWVTSHFYAVLREVIETAWWYQASAWRRDRWQEKPTGVGGAVI